MGKPSSELFLRCIGLLLELLIAPQEFLSTDNIGPQLRNTQARNKMNWCLMERSWLPSKFCMGFSQIPCSCMEENETRYWESRRCSWTSLYQEYSLFHIDRQKIPFPSLCIYRQPVIPTKFQLLLFLSPRVGSVCLFMMPFALCAPPPPITDVFFGGWNAIYSYSAV